MDLIDRLGSARLGWGVPIGRTPHWVWSFRRRDVLLMYVVCINLDGYCASIQCRDGVDQRHDEYVSKDK